MQIMKSADDALLSKAAAMFINFSGILSKDVLDSDGKFIGRLWDISLKLSDVYPKSDELVIRKSAGYFKFLYAVVPWSSVAAVEEDGIALNTKNTDIKFEGSIKDFEFLLKRDVLDQQVVDTYNHKVRRVNDVHLLRVDQELMLAHVDIGIRGLLRRLGWEGGIDFFVRLFNKKAPYLKRAEIVSWKYVHPVSANPASMMMKLSVSGRQLSSIPAADLSEIMLDLNMKQRMALFRALDVKTKARIFENMEFEEQKLMLKELDKKEAVQIVTNMSSDEAADLLERLPRNAVENMLTLMESNRAKKLSTLMGYSSDSAGGFMTTEFVSMHEAMPVSSAIEYIRNETRNLEAVPYIYIIDDKNHLKGATTVRRLLFAEPKDAVIKTIFPKTFHVSLNDGVKEVAYLMDKYKISTIAVIDENNFLHGIITMDDILSQVISIAWRKRTRKPKGL